MHGILDLDVLCLTEIFKFLNPLDLCSLRQSCTQLRDSVEDHFRSLYFAREQWLDLTGVNIRNIRYVSRILKNFGKLVPHLKVSGDTRRRYLLLDVILTNCGATLKGLSLNNLRSYEIDMEKFAGVFDNLEFLEIICCFGYEKSFEQFLLGHQYPNLTTLIMKYSLDGTEILQKFFMTKRTIKKLIIDRRIDDILPLIVLNASEIEELSITPEDGTNMMSLVRLTKLKRLEIDCEYCDERSITSSIKELSVINQLEMLGIVNFEFTDEFCDALSNLTNLKELRLHMGRCSSNDTKSLEMLGRKLSKLKSLTLWWCSDFPYRRYLASASKSDNFRTFYVHSNSSKVKKFIEALARDVIEGRGHRSLVLGDPLRIYILKGMFDVMKGLLTQENLQSIEKFGNIKILPCNDDVFWAF